jgi:hypothetical protein
LNWRLQNEKTRELKQKSPSALWLKGFVKILSRAACPNFEPLAAAFVELALSNSPVSTHLLRFARLSA